MIGGMSERQGRVSSDSGHGEDVVVIGQALEGGYLSLISRHWFLGIDDMKGHVHESRVVVVGASHLHKKQFHLLPIPAQAPC